MAGKDKKTEHSGAKKGKGAYWGKKKDAKEESKKSRREQDKRESRPTNEADHELNTNAVLEEALLGEWSDAGFEKLDQLREFMSDSDILEELIKYLPESEWNEHYKTMMQYYSGNPDFGME